MPRTQNSGQAPLEQALELVDLIAELRSAATTAEFFLAQQTPREQAEWTRELLERSNFVGADNGPHVTLLDTGVQYGHPLLSPLLDAADAHAVDPAWGSNDHHGHGTEMAGLVGHGELSAAFASNDRQHVPHRLESVKILPPNGANPPHLYGWVTAQAVRLVEDAKPDRTRTFATMTTAIGRTAGMPSEWSAAVDQLAFGLDATNPYPAGSSLPEQGEAPLMRRLFVLSAGNVPWQNWVDLEELR